MSNDFLKNLGDDEWVAFDQYGNPISRASDRVAVELAAPSAIYTNGAELRAEAGPAKTAKPAPAVNPLDHDGDGKPGGSLSGDEATASKSRQRKPKD